MIKIEFEVDETFISKWMENLVEEIGMKIIKGPFTAYVTKEGNRGLTAIVMIETSHIALHVWDETNPGMIQFDLYTCSTLPVDLVIKSLEDNLGLSLIIFMAQLKCMIILIMTIAKISIISFLMKYSLIKEL